MARRGARRLRPASIAPVDASGLLGYAPDRQTTYLHATDAHFDAADHLDDIRRIIPVLDLIIAVPIETPDRIPVTEGRRLRRRVDDLLLPLLLDDPHAFAIPTIEVHGTLPARTHQVLRAMRVA